MLMYGTIFFFFFGNLISFRHYCYEKYTIDFFNMVHRILIVLNFQLGVYT